MQSDKSVVFSAEHISKTFGAGKSLKTAVDDVSFKIYDEEFISIVGGSGCGKSVLAKIMLGLYKPTEGKFLYRDHPIRNLKDHWNEVQSVFQDPFGCFNQFFTIRSQLEDALNILKDKPSREEVKKRVDEGLLAVNVTPADIEGKYPFELSGGQMQRMLLARIFALKPKVLIADEATSMVDACVRANILDYLRKLKDQLKMTVVFVTHDIGLANYVSDRIFVMHAGRIVNQGTPAEVLDNTTEPNTLRLLDDIPEVHKDEWIPNSHRSKKHSAAASAPQTNA